MQDGTHTQTHGGMQKQIPCHNPICGSKSHITVERILQAIIWLNIHDLSLSYSFWLAFALHDQNRRQACNGKIGSEGTSCSSMSDAWHQATQKVSEFLSNISWVQLEITSCFLYRETGHPPQSSRIGTAVHHFQRPWHFQGSSKRKTAGKTGKTRSLSSVLGLPNRKAAKCFSHLGWCGWYTQRIEMKSLDAATGHLIHKPTNMISPRIKDSQRYLYSTWHVFGRWQSWNVHITKYH